MIVIIAIAAKITIYNDHGNTERYVYYMKHIHTIYIYNIIIYII